MMYNCSRKTPRTWPSLTSPPTLYIRQARRSPPWPGCPCSTHGATGTGCPAPPAAQRCPGCAMGTAGAGCSRSRSATAGRPCAWAGRTGQAPTTTRSRSPAGHAKLFGSSHLGRYKTFQNHVILNSRIAYKEAFYTMKILIKAHIVTAILGWILMAIGAGVVISEEGSLPAALSLCLMGVVTAITLMDLLSVYFAKIHQPPVLPILSALFWGMVLILYSWAMFSPNDPWQGKVVYGVLILTALFKFMASASIVKLYFAR